MSLEHPPQQPPSEPRKESAHNLTLQWNDLLFLGDMKTSWGLRHRTGVDRARDEMVRGVINGDAVALSAPQNLIPHSDLPPGMVFDGTVLPLTRVDKHLNDTQRQRLIEDYQKAVRSFIAMGVRWDLNIGAKEEDTVQEFLTRLQQNNAYLIGTFEGAQMPYDLESLFMLGKAGKQTVPPHTMIALILPDMATNTEYTEDNLSQQPTEEKYNQIIESATDSSMAQVIQIIKSRGMTTF